MTNEELAKKIFENAVKKGDYDYGPEFVKKSERKNRPDIWHKD